MPTYHYQLIADIEIDAPNIMAAEKVAHRAKFYDSRIPEIRATGSYLGGVRLPSQRKDEPCCRIQVRVDYGKIKRKPNEETV